MARVVIMYSLSRLSSYLLAHGYFTIEVPGSFQQRIGVAFLLQLRLGGLGQPVGDRISAVL